MEKIISFMLMVLLIGTNFITACPSADMNGVAFHLIAEPCTTHDCERSVEAESCEKEDCEHGLCSDTPVSDEFIVTQIDRLVAVSSLPVKTAGDFIYPVCATAKIFNSSSPPVPPQRCNAVLRI